MRAPPVGRHALLSLPDGMLKNISKFSIDHYMLHLKKKYILEKKKLKIRSLRFVSNLTVLVYLKMCFRN